MIKKLYWKLRNKVEATYLSTKGGTGLLTTRPDPRDEEAEFGLSLFPYKPKYNVPSKFKYQFNQNPFNICVFASTVLALSEQTGIRFSIKFMVKVAQREGMITGNGWSYQRAALEIVVKYGLVPYEMMPDEIGNQSYEVYSAWTSECDNLLKFVAPLYKFSRYKKLKNELAIIEASDNGYVPVVASDWSQSMFYPKSPDFLLNFEGESIGGHQYRITKYDKYPKARDGHKLETPQTFGAQYGNVGRAWSETTTGKRYYDNWIVMKDGKPTLN